jgi:phosphoribosylglycinamide formyltransferase-1
MTLSIGWFTTGRGEGSRAMYRAVRDAIRAGALDAEIAVLFCNRAPGESPATDALLTEAQVDGVPVVTRSSVAFRGARGGELSRTGAPLPAWRAEYDRAVDTDLTPHAFAIGVLAGYMLILSAEFVARRALLNFHPALPTGPAGTSREVIRALIRERAEESGVMMHLAIAEVDAGPVASFCRYPLRDEALAPLWREIEPRIDAGSDEELEQSALFAAIRERGLRQEAPLLVATLRACAEGRLRVADGRILGSAPLELPAAATSSGAPASA